MIIIFSVLINKNSVLQFLGRNSLIIMCTHEPIKRIVIFAISKINDMSQDILRYNIVGILIITIVLLAILMPIIIIVNRYLPFLISKTKKKVNEN